MEFSFTHTHTYTHTIPDHLSNLEKLHRYNNIDAATPMQAPNVDTLDQCKMRLAPIKLSSVACRGKLH